MFNNIHNVTIKINVSLKVVKNANENIKPS